MTLIFISQILSIIIIAAVVYIVIMAWIAKHKAKKFAKEQIVSLNNAEKAGIIKGVQIVLENSSDGSYSSLEQLVNCANQIPVVASLGYFQVMEVDESHKNYWIFFAWKQSPEFVHNFFE